MIFFKCKACDIKDQQIEDLKGRSNMPDELRDKWISDLQGQIVYLRNENDKLNREKKRLFDTLLLKSGVAPVSEEAYSKAPSQGIDVMEAFASMFEETKEN